MKRILAEQGRVLAFGAHPDDLEVGAGGLLARLAKEGASVTMAVVSIPNRFDERKAEAIRGAEVIGGTPYFVFGEKQTRVEDLPMHELVRRFDAVVADVKPDLVITHAHNDIHWDHGLVHRATVSALRRTPCDLLAFLSSPEMNAQAKSHGQCFADVTETIEVKLAAIQCHGSQLKNLDVDSSRDLARAMGRISGYGFAEGYEVLRMRI